MCVYIYIFIVWVCTPRECCNTTVVLHARAVLQCSETAWQHNAAVSFWYCNSTMLLECHHGDACQDSAAVPLCHCIAAHCCSATVVLQL